MNIVIVGASGPTGALAVNHALAKGHTVTAVSRRGTDFAGVQNLTADAATDAGFVTGADAVVSCVGVPYSSKAITTYSAVTESLIAAMTQLGVPRLIVTSSSATDPAVRFKSAGEGALLELLKPLIIFGFGRTTYVDMRRMESAVRASHLDWTIVRPSGLYDTDEVGRHEVERNHIRGGFTSRADLAAFLIDAIDTREWVGEAAAIASREGNPSVLEFIRAQASG
jgi:nucleoside-diphosphate-sugar epimerase